MRSEIKRLKIELKEDFMQEFVCEHSGQIHENGETVWSWIEANILPQLKTQDD